MMRLKIDMMAPGCEGRLPNRVAEVEIVNTMKGPAHKRKYEVAACFRKENKEVSLHKFTIIHNRQDAMWVLVGKVVKKIQELEAQKELKRIQDYLDAVRRPEGE